MVENAGMRLSSGEFLGIIPGPDGIARHEVVVSVLSSLVHPEGLNEQSHWQKARQESMSVQNLSPFTVSW